MYGCDCCYWQTGLEILMPKNKKMFKSILKKYGKKKGKGLYYALERNRKKKKKGY